MLREFLLIKFNGMVGREIEERINGSLPYLLLRYRERPASDTPITTSLIVCNAQKHHDLLKKCNLILSK